MEYAEFVERARRQMADELDLDVQASELALSLNRASGILTYAAESSIHRPRGLVWSSFRVLFTLWVVGGVEQSRLGELTSSSKATVSNLVISLERDGLVERLPLETDRRTRMVHLTGAGVARVREALTAQDALFVQWTSVLDADERETLIVLLAKLMDRRDMMGITGS